MKKYISVISSYLIFFIILRTIVFNVYAQTPASCNGVSIVQVQPTFSLNIRKEAGGTSGIIGSLKYADGEKCIIEKKKVNDREFLKIRDSGWIINNYLSIVDIPPTSTPTPLKPTNTLTVEITPTRISGTPEPGAWYCDPYGCVYLVYPVSIYDKRP